MTKNYKVLKDTFLWEKGAILKKCENDNRYENDDGYEPIDDVFKKFDDIDEYISSSIIENNPEWFERVYKINLLTKVIYRGKEEAKTIIEKEYKE